MRKHCSIVAILFVSLFISLKIHSKEYISDDTIKMPFKEVVEGNINKDSSFVQGKIEENEILTLENCIKKALSNNPKINSAKNYTEIYKTKIGQAWSNYFPTLSMTNGLTRNRYLVINYTVEQQEYTFYNAIDLSGSQLIFDFGKTKALADMAKYNFEATKSNLEETVNDIIYNVTSSYYNLLYANEKKKVYQDTVKNFQIQLNQAEAFYNLGKKPKIDVTISQYNLENAKLGLLESENEIESAQSNLNEAMGIPEYDNYEVFETLNIKKYKYNFEDLLTKAFDKRPELKMYQHQIKASKMLVRASQRAITPNIEVFGEIQVGGGTRFTDDYGWTIGMQLHYTNFNIFLLKKQLDEAKATHQKDIADLKVKENAIHNQVKQAYIKLKNAENSIPIAELSLKEANEEYKLAKGRYFVGISEITELKDAENTYKNARLDYISTLLKYNLAIAETEKVIGDKLEENDTAQTEVEEIIE